MRAQGSLEVEIKMALKPYLKRHKRKRKDTYKVCGLVMFLVHVFLSLQLCVCVSLSYRKLF